MSTLEPAAPPSGTRRRLDHIDAMRPVKQAAVISTHALIFFAPLATSTTVVGLIMLTRFSRDAFLFVSACMLTYSYRSTTKVAVLPYAKRRFMSVGVPYLTWTLLYFIYTSLSARSTFPYYALDSARVFSWSGLRILIHLTATGYYHLYYLLVIGEFYVLFPIMLRFIRRHPTWHGRMMVGALLWQVAYGAWVSSHHSVLALSGLLQTRLIFSYVIYIVGGVIVALHLDEVHQWIVHHVALILGGTLAAMVLAEVLTYVGAAHDLPTYVRTGVYVFSPLIIPYNIGAILCIYLLGVFLTAPARRARIRAMVQSGSDNSYGVYLSQMVWIPALVRLRAASGLHIPWQVAAPLALVIVYSVGFIFTALMARTWVAKGVTGRSRATWASLWPRRQLPAVVERGDVADGPMDVVEP